MGILGWIADTVIGIGHAIVAGIASIFGIKIKPRPSSEKIRAELRQQWLDLAPGETDIPGVEWEGEIYYETPK
jgi:hypothetical protein